MSANIKKIDAQLKKLDPSFRKTQKSSKGLGDTFRKGALQAAAMGTGIGAVALGVGKLASIVSGGVRSFAAFESSMVRIETLVGLSRKEVEGMTGALREISKATGRGPQELSEALFQITSAGLRGSEAMDTLQAAAKASAIGLGSVATIADIATSAMNAYGSENITAEKAVGVLLKTVREGKASPEELAASLGRVIPVAATMGITFSEVSGIVASMTRIGFSSAESVTSIRGSMLSILNPSEQAKKVLKEVGLSMEGIRKTVDEDGLLAALQLLRESLTDEQFAKFIGRAEALAGALGVTGQRFSETAAIVKSTADTMGELEVASERVGDTATQQAAIVRQEWQDTKDSIGELFVAYARGAKEFSDSLRGAFDFSEEELDGIIGATERGVSSFENVTTAAKAFAKTQGDLAGEIGTLGIATRDAFDVLAEVDADVGAAVRKAAEDAAKAVKEAAVAAKLKEKADKAAAAAVKQHSQEIDRLAESLGKGGLKKELDNMIEGLARLSDANKELSSGGGQQVVDLVDELRENMIPVPPMLAQIALQTRAMNVEFKDLALSTPEIPKTIGAMADGMDEFFESASRIPPVVAGIGDLTKTAEERQQEYNRALQDAANLAQIIPGILGDIVSQSVAAAGALSNLSSAGGSLGGLGKAFSGSGVGKALGKFGKIAGDLGPLVGIGIQLGTALVKGISSVLKSGPNLVRDASRDLGATITKEMADAIEKSGRPIQLAVADIFQSGGFESADRFAQEIGDIFSGLGQGAFGKPEAITALEQAVPLLLQNLKELGPAGEAEIQRIISAAREMGVEFDGLSALINSTFATQTLEQMKESLGLTGEEVRALANSLGVDLQTNLERAAVAAGLTVAEFKALQEAAGGVLGQDTAATMEQLATLMEATGLSAQELAERLNVDVAGGAATLAEEAARGQSELSGAADQASRLADELGRAVRNAGGITLPGGGGFDAGGGIPSFAKGAFVPRAQLAVVGDAPGGEFIVPAAQMRAGGGGDIVQTFNLAVNFEGHPDEFEFKDRIVQIVRDGIEEGTRGIRGAIAHIPR